MAVLQTGCGSLTVSHYYQRGVVVSASPIASEMGRDVLQRGGNAFDAAVAVGFALAVVHPQAGNLGGGGFAVVRDGKSGAVVSLDFRETAPLAASEDMYLDKNGEIVEKLSTYGALAAGVPGTVAGLRQLWDRFGTLPWEDLVKGAAQLADTGFVVSEHLNREVVKYREELNGFPETRALFFPSGQAPKAGEKLSFPDLAGTLYLLASEGSDVFYTGSVADKLVACMQAHGGLITHTDLAQYRPIWRQPVRFSFDSLEIYSMAPPSSGGIALAQILKLIEPYDFAPYGADSPEYIHLLCEASRLAFADRSEHLGDPDFRDVPSGLTDEEYLDGRRSKINLRRAGSSNEISPGLPGKYESDQTTHYCVCDADGNMVSVTYTLNASFGSKLIVAGAGFLLNNEMDDFSIKPGHPNLYGLIGGEANKIEPGKRMLSSMSPTLVLHEGRPFLVLGSPGGSKIITTVAEALVGLTRFHLSPAEVVAQPRFHHQWLPDILYLEKDGFPRSVIGELERMGHEVRERSSYGDLQVIYIGPTGFMTGASDPRGGGAPAGY